MKTHILILSTFFIALSSVAEFRLWSDKDGNYIEAKYDSINGHKICLILRDGKKLNLPISALLASDQQYLSELIFPSIPTHADEKKIEKSITQNNVTSSTNGSNDINYDDFIRVQGVRSPRPFSMIDDSIGKQWFSYLPRSGVNKKNALVIECFNAPAGKHAEGVVLRVLFGMHYPVEKDDFKIEEDEGKIYHIYKIRTRKQKWHEVYIDATQYHGLY